ncbi:TetR/AcrR family transcriptional regulator [Chimaeribacter arupi]|uniref:TetR/AcrR family transcriptional regulator n=1 Tax=Chimaeribacter arupi TaxID=2060066 RepID=UPI000C7B44F8|nr:TetR/AcrR family transcriptional regulator [Chimaeribacter arupi]PLR52805.1 TetR family transcriptional regulator [Chimaeribacter arupi]
MERENTTVSGSAARRLKKAERRKQLLNTALLIVQEENADQLTLGHLAVRAGVSKPVVYDHFPTRSALLIALYRWIDMERVRTFTEAMTTTRRDTQETIQMLASAYIHCAADKTDAFHAVGAALAGSEEKSAVFQALLENCVGMFVSVLTPHVTKSPRALLQCCIGLVGAGEALSAALARGQLNQDEAVASFASLIKGAVQVNES